MGCGASSTQSSPPSSQRKYSSSNPQEAQPQDPNGALFTSASPLGAKDTRSSRSNAPGKPSPTHQRKTTAHSTASVSLGAVSPGGPKPSSEGDDPLIPMTIHGLAHPPPLLLFRDEEGSDQISHFNRPPPPLPMAARDERGLLPAASSLSTLRVSREEGCIILSLGEPAEDSVEMQIQVLTKAPSHQHQHQHQQQQFGNGDTPLTSSPQGALNPKVQRTTPQSAPHRHGEHPLQSSMEGIAFGVMVPSVGAESAGSRSSLSPHESRSLSSVAATHGDFICLPSSIFGSQ
jgi:hypothetical protein